MTDTMSYTDGPEPLPVPKEARRELATIAEALGGLNETLSYQAPYYDSLVVFASQENDPVATPLLTLDAVGSNGYQHDFRDKSIMQHRLLKRHTALGQALASPHDHLFSESKLNKDYQMVFTLPLTHGDERIAALQYSFTEHYGGEGISLPDALDLEKIARDHSGELHAATASIAALQRMAAERRKTVPRMLRKYPALAPNSFIVRWDAEGATDLMAGEQQPLIDDLFGDIHVALQDLVDDYLQHPDRTHWNLRQAYSGEGDGAYTVLSIPDAFNTYDPSVRASYSLAAAQPFMEAARQRIEELVAMLPETLRPTIHISGDFGYTETYGDGRLNSPTMYTLAKAQKQK